MKERLTSIIKDKVYPGSMDYQLLRKEAIHATQQMSGDKWTDYNIHDPGVTILEQFCYALTDIAYRTNLNIETLLFHEGNRDDVIRSNALYAAEDIFPTCPVTLSDYRILILDHFPDKISNCWVNTITNHREGIQGLYDIKLLLKSDVRPAEHAVIKKEIRKLFVANRNLCEDIHSVQILKPEKIRFSVDIDIYQDENAEEILAEILYQVENYFNPAVRFLSIEELEARSWGLEEIFDIPSHKHGFITAEQLKPKQQEFHVSKIADHIIGVKGVRSLRNLSVTQDGVPVQGDTMIVDDEHYLTLGLLNGQKDDSLFEGFNIAIYKGGIVNRYLEQAVIYSLEIKEAKTHRNYEIQTRAAKKTEEKVKTAALTSYGSIQKSFPGIYGIGDYTPAKEDGKLRIAQSKQLQAYLLFFDQIMANHLVQLSKISGLFSVHEVSGTSIRTYFTQLLDEGTPGASDLLKQKVPGKTRLLERIAELELSREKHGDKERTEYNNLLLDLQEKERVVRNQVTADFNSLIKLPEEKLKRSSKFGNREIIAGLVELKKLGNQLKELLEEGSDAPEELNRQIGRKTIEVEELMTAELMEQEQFIDFEERHLDHLMLNFDEAGERKNRILTHLLARFGERFTTDFHIRFSSFMEGESRENIQKRLISLKSVFLKEIVNLNRFRSKGVNYYVPTPADSENPLRRKVSLLLNIDAGANGKLASSVLKTRLKATKLTGADIVRKKSGNSTFIQPKQSGNKITFLVNSSSYYTYLFKYGLKETNYSIEPEDNRFIIYFNPPTGEPATRLMEASSKEEAHQKTEALINLLKKLNLESEGFHLVEHILLRPQDSTDCYFTIRGKDGKASFKSKEAQPEGIQKKAAHDTLLLACYPNNYKILQNPKREFVVLIKNAVGIEMAKSTVSFTTEPGAQKFIDESVAYYKSRKKEDTLDHCYELNNQKKYYFDLVDKRAIPLFQSTHALSLSKQEKIIEALAIYTVNPACYRIEKNEENKYFVGLTNYSNREIVRSGTVFNTSEEADAFIQRCLTYFEKISAARTFKSIIRFRRTDGRNASDFNSQLSVVYSDWSSRFHNEEFLALFKQTLFNAAPAHLAINMVGLKYVEMQEFEKLYFEYMKELPDASLENQAKMANLSNGLMHFLMDRKR